MFKTLEYMQPRRCLSSFPLVDFFLFSPNCLPEPGSDIRIKPAQPHFFTWQEGGATLRVTRKKKQGRANQQTARCVPECVCVCVFTSLGFILKTVKRGSLSCWWAFWRSHGGPGFSTSEYGTTEDLWLFWVWQLGEDRFRWIWTSLQSPACRVENMAGHQMSSLPSRGWKVSHSLTSFH